MSGRIRLILQIGALPIEQSSPRRQGPYGPAPHCVDWSYKVFGEGEEEEGLEEHFSQTQIYGKINEFNN